MTGPLRALLLLGSASLAFASVPAQAGPLGEALNGA